MKTEETLPLNPQENSEGLESNENYGATAGILNELKLYKWFDCIWMIWCTLLLAKCFIDRNRHNRFVAPLITFFLAFMFHLIFYCGVDSRFWRFACTNANYALVVVSWSLLAHAYKPNKNLAGITIVICTVFGILWTIIRNGQTKIFKDYSGT